MTEENNWFQRLAEKLPGFAGYSERERRRDADKAQREHMADRVRAAKAPLMQLVRELSSSGRLGEVGPVDRIGRKLDKIENRLRFASYGYSGFFDAVKIDNGALDALYRFDLDLMRHIEELDTKCHTLGAQADAPTFGAHAAELESLVDEMDRTLDNRSRAIEYHGSPGA